MKKKFEHMTRAPSGTLSRREVLAGAALAALAVSAPAALAAPVAQPRRKNNQPSRTAGPVRRYMAAAAVLGDGRVLVTGGYDRPWDGDTPPSPLRSAMIYDPAGGAWSVARPMSTPRARHAAVATRGSASSSNLCRASIPSSPLTATARAASARLRKSGSRAAPADPRGGAGPMPSLTGRRRRGARSSSP